MPQKYRSKADKARMGKILRPLTPRERIRVDTWYNLSDAEKKRIKDSGMPSTKGNFKVFKWDGPK